MISVFAKLLTLLTFVLGTFFVVAGAKLILLDGSSYYFLAGVCFLFVSALLIRRSAAALWAYSSFMFATIIWALYESGVDPWALMPRLVAPAVFGILFSLPGLVAASRAARLARVSCVAASVLAVALVVGSYAVTSTNTVDTDGFTSAVGTEGASDWPYFGGDAGGQRHIKSSQITRSNIADLELAWTYRVSGAGPGESTPEGSATAESTPIEVDGRLYFCSSNNVAIALDSETGEEIWRYDPAVALTPATHTVCRGVAYAETDAKAEVCSSRIFMGTLDNRLVSLDSQTGLPCSDFGNHGFVDLDVGLGEVLAGYNYVTSPPTILSGTIVVGSFVFDNQSTSEPSGVVRAFDIADGRLLWAWDVLHPESRPPLQQGEQYARNTPNVWSVASVDADLGLIFLPTGNTPPDFFGGHRSAQQDRYPSSVVALDIKTGDVRWNFQTVNHDIWDFDIASQPVAVQWQVESVEVPALLVPTKRGEVFVLDRRSGKPLTEVVQRAVPQGPEDGEWLSPTQPYSVEMPSFSPPDLNEKSMWGATPLDQLWCRLEFRRARYDGQFTPPSTQGVIAYPGAFGIINWGRVSVDPGRNLMLVNTSNLPWYQRLVPRPEADVLGIAPWGEPSPHETVSHSGREVFYAQAGTPYAIDSRPFLSPLGYPCHEPPWGELAAVDLGKQQVLWRRPLGTTRDVAPFGVPLPTGVFNIGGSVTTESGLTFIAATVDNYLRAFDTESGQELWKARLPAGGQSNPISYVSGRDGRQYVLIAAGGHVPMATKAGDYVLAYALPRDEK